MAKQRRPPSRQTKARPGPLPHSPRSESLGSFGQGTAATPAPPAPERRSTYIEAVALYERGLEQLQRHDYRGAAALFESVLAKYGEEKELHEEPANRGKLAGRKTEKLHEENRDQYPGSECFERL